VVNLRFSTAENWQVTLDYTTGSWFALLSGSKQKYERLQDDDNQFYFLDRGTKQIDTEFMFNRLVKTASNTGEITLDLLIKIKSSVVLLLVLKTFSH
jgi:hypothetical protein